jgi:transcriptional regulator NrdR family protein
VTNSRLAADHRTRIRTYQCEECAGRFRTRESVESQELGQVFVRKANPGGVHWEPFRRDEIGEQLRRKLVKVLTQSQRDRLVTQVEQRLEQRLGEIAQPIPATVARQRRLDRNLVFVDSSAVRDVVEEVLSRGGRELDSNQDRQRHQAAHALYTLSTLGSTWQVSDALNWIQINYKFPRVTAPRGLSTNTVAWHPPALRLPTIPLTVVKNFRPLINQPPQVNLDGAADEISPSTEQNGWDATDTELVRPEDARANIHRPTQDFRVEKLRSKVSEVLSGRRYQEQISEGITNWVLWSLVGQTVVRSSQISALVVDCLRRADPISYLRWVIVGKELTIDQIYQEAKNLLLYPSPRLHFRPDSAPQVLPNVLPGMEFPQVN